MTKQQFRPIICKDFSIENNAKIQKAKKGDEQVAAQTFALKTIILALNSPDDAILKAQALSDHKFMHDSYNRAVEKRDKLLAENLTTLEQMAPEERKVAEDSLRQIVVLPYIKEYVEGPMCSILAATCNVSNQTPITCVVVDIEPVKPVKVKDYYAVYLIIDKTLQTASKSGEEMTVVAAIQQFFDDKEEEYRPMSTVTNEMIGKAYRAIKKAVEFYDPRYQQLFGEDPLKKLNQPE